jgi:hypothetical protein
LEVERLTDDRAEALREHVAASREENPIAEERVYGIPQLSAEAEAVLPPPTDSEEAALQRDAAQEEDQ